MQIGSFGEDLIFETSDKRILTFNDFNRGASSRWEEHAVIGQKPRGEFIGPELQTVTFTIKLNAALGVVPQEEIDKLIKIVESGTADYLVIGGLPLGDDRWIILSISEARNRVLNSGELYSATLDVAMKEYISEM
jgi:phage protein U